MKSETGSRYVTENVITLLSHHRNTRESVPETQRAFSLSTRQGVPVTSPAYATCSHRTATPIWAKDTGRVTLRLAWLLVPISPDIYCKCGVDVLNIWGWGCGGAVTGPWITGDGCWVTGSTACFHWASQGRRSAWQTVSRSCLHRVSLLPLALVGLNCFFVFWWWMRTKRSPSRKTLSFFVIVAGKDHWSCGTFL